MIINNNFIDLVSNSTINNYFRFSLHSDSFSMNFAEGSCWADFLLNNFLVYHRVPAVACYIINFKWFINFWLMDTTGYFRIAIYIYSSYLSSACNYQFYFNFIFYPSFVCFNLFVGPVSAARFLFNLDLQCS